MRLFITENFIQKLKKNALKGSLRSSRFRSIAWRIFLDCLPEQRAGWLSFAQQLRDEYDMIRNKYNINPYTVNDSNFAHNNPLSQEESVSALQLVKFFFFNLIYYFFRVLGINIFVIMN